MCETEVRGLLGGVEEGGDEGRLAAEGGIHGGQRVSWAADRVV